MEVDTALFKEDVTLPPALPAPTLKDRVDEVRMRGVEKLDELKRTASMKVADVQNDIHSNPRKWASIAAGAGLGLGLIGRYLTRRTKRRHVPHLMIIEAC